MTNLNHGVLHEIYRGLRWNQGEIIRNIVKRHEEAPTCLLCETLYFSMMSLTLGGDITRMEDGVMTGWYKSRSSFCTINYYWQISHYFSWNKRCFCFIPPSMKDCLSFTARKCIYFTSIHPITSILFLKPEFNMDHDCFDDD